METNEYRRFISHLSEKKNVGISLVEILELYAINAVCKIAHSIGDEE